MRKLSKLLGGVAIAAIMAATPALAKDYKFAFQGDTQGLDPHGLNETFSLGFLGNVYEGLTGYDGNISLVPALATEWKTTSPKVWLVKLRQGVKFHNGNDFNADDVVFSFARSQSEGSDQKTRGGLVTKVVNIDDYTIELHTKNPLPVLMQEMAFLYMMDKEWSEANGTAEA
ncbi:MAG: ABC transporter substrate-binding protein, partial [Rhizobiaceae bacterium]|nr:ABC transporter substrate-binding protein [Rhizobiaceae bacterium]